MTTREVATAAAPPQRRFYVRRVYQVLDRKRPLMIALYAKRHQAAEVVRELRGGGSSDQSA